MSITTTNVAIAKAATTLGIVQLERRQRARVLAVALQKGGVGKTTFTLIVAAIAALCGLRVLIIDMDPQGNATDTIVTEEWNEEEDEGLAQALDPTVKGTTLWDVIVPTVWPGVEIAPAFPVDMAQAEKHIIAMDHGRESRLREEIEPLRDKYDLILIDCPPALGMLTINGLTAAEEVAVIAEPDKWSKNGLHALAQTIKGVKKYSNKALRYAFILLNKWQGGDAGRVNERRILDDVRTILVEDTNLAAGDQDFQGAIIWDQKVPQLENIRATVHAALPLTEAKDVKVRMLVELVFVPLLRHIMTDKDAS